MITLLKQIFFDIFGLYKNFGHWFISKLLISFSRYIITLLYLLPFLVLFLIVIWMSPYSFLDYQRILQDILVALYPLSNNFLDFTVWNIVILLLLLLIIIGGMVGIFYNRMLLAKLHLKYINGKKLKYRKNDYFSTVLFVKYLGISAYLIGLVVSFTIIFIIGFILLFFTFGGYNEVSVALENANGFSTFSVMSVIYFILCIIGFSYSLYRLNFAYFIQVENTKKTVLWCMRKSFKLTKGYKKLLKFMGVMFVLFAVYMPFDYISQVINFNAKNVSNYMGMKQAVGIGEANEVLVGERFYEYTQLNPIYNGLSSQELVEKLRFLTIMSWIYFICHFVFLYGIFDMVLMSFYKRELLKDSVGKF